MHHLQQYREKKKNMKKKRSEICTKAAACRLKSNNSSTEEMKTLDSPPKQNWVSQRNLRGYRHDSTPYYSPDNGDFDRYSIVNIGCLNDMIAKVQQHARACDGSLSICHKDSNLKTHFHGGMFSRFPLMCTNKQCSFRDDDLYMENDFFNKPPSTKDRSSCDSNLVGCLAVASHNISFVETEVSFLFSCLGLQFPSTKTFQTVVDRVRGHINEMTKESLNENISEEKIQSLKNFPQQAPQRNAFQNCPYSADELRKLKVPQLKAFFQSAQIATTKDRKADLIDKCLSLKTNEDELRNQVAAKYGQRNWVRGRVSADGSYPVRGFKNAAWSNYCQVVLFGQETKLPIYFGYRCITCATCERAKTIGKEINHKCFVNYDGAITTMESDITTEGVLELLKQGFIAAEVTLDADCNTQSKLQETLIKEPIRILKGGESLVDVTYDMNHICKASKNEMYKICDRVTVTHEKKKYPPMIPKFDAIYLSRLLNHTRYTVINRDDMSFNQKVEMYTMHVHNYAPHYFNDDPGVHSTCAKICPHSCRVVVTRRMNRINMLKDKVNASSKILGCIYVMAFGKGGGSHEIEPPVNFSNYVPKDPSSVKSSLADGMWLGTRCRTSNQVKAFRAEMEKHWHQYGTPAVAQKIVRTGTTQLNEAIHSTQSRLHRKDLNHGSGQHYVARMKAGILKKCHGVSFVAKLADRFGVKLPVGVVDLLAKTDLKSEKLKAKRATKRYKMQRKENKASSIKRRRKQQPNGGEYVGDGGALKCTTNQTKETPKNMEL